MRTAGLIPAVRERALESGPLGPWTVPSVVLAAGTAWVAGRSIAFGGRRSLLFIALAAVSLLVTVVFVVYRSRIKPGFIAIEMPVILLLLSGLVLRQRDASALASNPLDSAGLYRAVCVTLAVGLAAIALTHGRHRAADALPLTRPFRIYCAYIVVVFVGALLSVDAPLTAYRGYELVAGVLVLLAANRVAGTEAMQRIETMIFWSIALTLAAVWTNVVLFPGEALHSSRSPLPLQLEGVLPTVSSNGVGTLGVLLTLWSIALLLSKRESVRVRPNLLRAFVVLGIVSLLFAQYRTGYIALVLGIGVLLVIRYRGALAFVVVAGVTIGVLWGASLVQQAEPVVLRGQSTEQAAGLSSRLDWWRDAIPVWKTSPWLGRGLFTATRFQVLAEIGRTSTSTIHGTWVEVLVGTGLIGLGLFASFVLILYARAVREGLRRNGRVVPMVLLTAFLVRSVTGSTLEGFGSFLLLALAFALTLSAREDGVITLADAGPDRGQPLTVPNASP